MQGKVVALSVLAVAVLGVGASVAIANLDWLGRGAATDAAPLAARDRRNGAEGPSARRAGERRAEEPTSPPSADDASYERVEAAPSDSSGAPRLVAGAHDLVPASLRAQYANVLRYAGPELEAPTVAAGDEEPAADDADDDADEDGAPVAAGPRQPLTLAQERARLKEIRPELREEIEADERDWAATAKRAEREAAAERELEERMGLDRAEREALEEGD